MSVDICPTPFDTISLNYDTAHLSDLSKNRTDDNSYDPAALSFRPTLRYRGDFRVGGKEGLKPLRV